MSKRPRVERRPRLGPAIYDNAKRLRQKQSILDTLMKTKAFTESWSYLQRFGITWHWRTKPWLVPESEDRDYMSANEKTRAEELRLRSWDLVYDAVNKRWRSGKLRLISSRTLHNLAAAIYKREFERDHPNNRDCPEREEIFIADATEMALRQAVKDYLATVIRDASYIGTVRQNGMKLRGRHLLVIPEDIGLALHMQNHQPFMTAEQIEGPYMDAARLHLKRYVLRQKQMKQVLKRSTVYRKWDAQGGCVRVNSRAYKYHVLTKPWLPSYAQRTVFRPHSHKKLNLWLSQKRRKVRQPKPRARPTAKAVRKPKPKTARQPKPRPRPKAARQPKPKPKPKPKPTPPKTVRKPNPNPKPKPKPKPKVVIDYVISSDSSDDDDGRARDTGNSGRGGDGGGDKGGDSTHGGAVAGDGDDGAANK